jgi:hypothetical protein
MGKDNTIKSLVDMYEAFDCDSKAMKDYLDKRMLIMGHNLTEQDKILHLYEERDVDIDGFKVMEWDAFLSGVEYFEKRIADNDF